MSESSVLRLSEFSREVADLVSRCEPSVVAIRQRRGRSVSGIVWRPGYVVTAAEALDEDSATLHVRVSAGTEHAAKLIGQDPSTDIALLGVEDLTTAGPEAADAAALRAGELVLALGRSTEHGPIVALGSVAVAGAPWESQFGGRIDRFIRLGV